VRAWSDKTEIAAERFIAWIGVARGKFFDWRKRYGKANEHNALVPRDHWLLDDEKRAIIDFHDKFPLEGYRRLTFMMIDRDVAAACSVPSKSRQSRARESVACMRGLDVHAASACGVASLSARRSIGVCQLRA
jgi:hypothetical protein